MADYTGEIIEVRPVKDTYDVGENMDLFVRCRADGYSFGATDLYWAMALKVFNGAGKQIGYKRWPQKVAAWERDHDWEENEHTFIGIGKQVADPGFEYAVVLVVEP